MADQVTYKCTHSIVSTSVLFEVRFDQLERRRVVRVQSDPGTAFDFENHHVRWLLAKQSIRGSERVECWEEVCV